MNQWGKKYWRVAIQTDVYGNRWLSAFIRNPEDPVLNWKEGDRVDILTEETEGGYLNFRLPTSEEKFLETLAGWEERIGVLEKSVDELLRKYDNSQKRQ